MQVGVCNFSQLRGWVRRVFNSFPALVLISLDAALRMLDKKLADARSHLARIHTDLASWQSNRELASTSRDSPEPVMQASMFGDAVPAQALHKKGCKRKR